MQTKFLIFLAASLCPAATLTVTPAFNADCTTGLGIATLTWSGGNGPVQILVGQPNGPALTAFTTSDGTATTGLWVNDGMTFYLVDKSGTVEASATAHLSCGGTPRTIDQGLGGGSYFPLAVGNTWVYKANSRFITASYIVWTISGTQTIGGQTYYALGQASNSPPTTIALLRAAKNGAIYQNANGVDQVYFDPNAAGNKNVGYSGPLGSFANAIQPASPLGLTTTLLTYVRGIGLVNSFSVDDTGSNGGFLNSLDLIDARVDGVHISVPAPKIDLSIENTNLDLTNQVAPNCAVPCYYPACGIGSSYDRPGMYRPCAQTRIDTSSTTAGYTVLLQLLDSTGTPVFQQTPQPGLNYIRLPLFTDGGGVSTPFTVLPPGDYKLVGSILNGTTPEATSSIAVHIK